MCVLKIHWTAGRRTIDFRALVAIEQRHRQFNFDAGQRIAGDIVVHHADANVDVGAFLYRDSEVAFDDGWLIGLQYPVHVDEV